MANYSAKKNSQKEIFYPASSQKELIGRIERIVFQNLENDYVIARFRLENKAQTEVIITGTLPGAVVGQRLRVEVERRNHPRFGEQFFIKRYTHLLPVTEEGMRLYLGSGLIQGIGDTFAHRIVAHFGKDTFRILDEDPDRLREVEGIGTKRLEMIKHAWQAQSDVREIMVFLAGHGISSTYAIKIYKQYGTQTLNILRENPYRLAEDIQGIGFLTADKIAQKIGVDPSEPARIESGLKYALTQAAEQGHLFLPAEELLQAAGTLLQLPQEALTPILKHLIKVGHLVADDGAIYLSSFYRWETELAARLTALARAPFRKLVPAKVFEQTSQLRRLSGVEYSPEQKEALFRALTEKVFVLTGGPGTGKTTLVNGLIQIFEQLGLRVYLAAPTGRAAKRMTEATGKKAKTIHRLLEYDPKTRDFARNQHNPLPAEVVIIDEMSMVDCHLAYKLVRAIPLQSRLIMVGDVDQLPSVGAGNVLSDLIQSGVIQTMELKQIFRQARDSLIVVNAHRINRGQMPVLERRKPNNKAPATVHSRHLKPREDYGDYLFVQEQDPEKISDMIVELVVHKLPKRYGYNPYFDIQILTPMYRGVLGADNLNARLQQELNADQKGIPLRKATLRIKDRVMQVRNNYDKMVFNGDIGFVKAIDKEEQKIVVAFDNLVSYEFHELDELVLAYAITVHKSQGSEFPVIILPLTTQHYIMLQRNLLYTAVTRAKDLLIILGSPKALSLAVRNNRTGQRNTRLARRLNALMAQNQEKRG